MQEYKEYKECKTIALLLLLALLVLPMSLNAQSKKQLEKDKAKVEQEIKKLNNDLAKAKKNSKAGQQQINLLERKIGERTKLINVINGEMNLLGEKMARTSDSIKLMQNQVDSLKLEYGKVVRVLYSERGNIDRMSLLFDSKSYNIAYLRQKYFRDYSRYRRRQASVIRDKERELDDITVELKRQQHEQSSLLEQHRRQKDELAREQKEQQKNLKNSRQQEQKLKNRIARKEKQKRELQQQIQAIINEEIAKAAKAKNASSGKKAGSQNAKTPVDNTASAADVALSNDFAANKRRLPWPVVYTKVAREYGRYQHASGGVNMNNGIDLVCAGGASVKCIFNGTVSRVFTCPNGTKGIIVRHGEYMTVYANLSNVAVSEGRSVTTGQNLGAVYTNSDGSAELSFQLWKGRSSQNPRSWLR